MFLKKVIALDQQAINGNEIFAKEYQDILQEIEQQNEHSIKSVKDILVSGIDEAGDILTSGIQEIGNYFRAGNVVQDSRPLIKFLTGGIWFLILTFCVPFMKSVFESPGERETRGNFSPDGNQGRGTPLGSRGRVFRQERARG